MRWVVLGVLVLVAAVLAWLLDEDVAVRSPSSRDRAAASAPRASEDSAPASSRGRREAREKRRAAEAAKPRPAFEAGRVDADAVARSDLTLRGVVVARGGAPVVDAVVKMSVTRVTSDHEFEPVRGDPERGFTGWRQSTEGSVTSGGGTQRTNAEGRFAIPLPGEGRVLVSVYAAGHHVARARLGWVNLSRSGMRFVLRSDPAPRRVRLLHGDQPCAGVEVRLINWSYGDAQPVSPPLRCDAEGAIPTSWFEPGDLFVVRLRLPKASAVARRHFWTYVLWADQETLDLSVRSGDVMQRALSEIKRETVAERSRHPWRTPPRLPATSK